MGETTVGEIDIELWSRECPKACRNFVQLCLEGYYDKTKFFRVVPDSLSKEGILQTLDLVASQFMEVLSKMSFTAGYVW